MDPVGDLALLAARDPRARFAAEDRLRAAGPAGVEALARLVSVEEIPKALRERAADLLGCILRERSVAAFRVAVPDPASPDLWAGAVAIAAEAHPLLEPRGLDEALGALVEGARDAVGPEGEVPARVDRLTRYLCDDLGFRGNRDDYGDLRNSYLPDVLERRTGIPVTLAVVWVTVAKSLGLAATGVGLPLHFVARCESEGGPLYVDAFGGEVLDEEGCRRLVARAAGREVALPAHAFRPLRPGEVLTRMLRNLEGAHERAGHLHMALASVERILHLSPLDGARIRDRALLFARLSRPAAAARSLSRAMALDPEGSERPRLEALRKALLRDAALRN